MFDRLTIACACARGTVPAMAFVVTTKTGTTTA
jgi:hypothetical protein